MSDYYEQKLGDLEDRIEELEEANASLQAQTSVLYSENKVLEGKVGLCVIDHADYEELKELAALPVGHYQFPVGVAEPVRPAYLLIAELQVRLKEAEGLMEDIRAKAVRARRFARGHNCDGTAFCQSVEKIIKQFLNRETEETEG